MFKWEHLPEKTLAWLEANWPGVWQREIIPIIDEGQIGAFETTRSLRRVPHRPAGNQPVSSTYDLDYNTLTASFTKEHARCDLRNMCGVKRRKQEYALCCERSRMATSKRRIGEKSNEFKNAYAVRAGIEAVNSEIKRAHGLGRIRDLVAGGGGFDYT